MERYNNLKENRGLKFLYDTILGRCLLKVFTSHIISNVYALYLNSSLSKVKIKKFVKSNNINIDEFENKKYTSFNDFFIRKIKKEKRKIDDGLISVCDSKLSVYEITDEISFKIKNSIYTIDELIDEKCDGFEYALVFRLGVGDYHHYVFPDDGKALKSKHINGVLHTVQPIAFKKNKVFLENARDVTFLKCDNLGKVCYIEVGAMMVGKIVNEKVTSFKKADEKGHFEFGGSTVILLIEKNKVKIKKEILKNTKEGYETIIKLGEKIGEYS